MELPGVDGDMLVYRAGFAVEKTQYHLKASPGPPMVFNSKAEMVGYCEDNDIADPEYTTDIVYEPESHALHAMREYIDKICRAVGADDVVVFLTGATNFRDRVATIKPYKGNRSTRKPIHYKALRRMLEQRYKAIVSYDMEADDLLAMHNGLMISADKDLLQVPGRHYNFLRDEFFDISEEDGDFNLFVQVLCGDATDNIPGCPGIGNKKAEGILAELYGQPRAMYDACLQVYEERWPEDHDLSPEEAMNETAELVYLLRYPEDSWQRKRNAL